MTTFRDYAATAAAFDQDPEEFSVQPDNLRTRTAELLRTKSNVRSGPSERATQAQHAKGKLTVWERIELLFDPDTFVELEPLRRHRATAFGLADKRPYSDGVVTGWGQIEGRTVFAYAHDFRVFGGALGEAHAAKIHKVMDMAIDTGAPLVSLSDGAGARIQEGVTALAGYGGIFRRNAAASGVIPQISVILGPCAGGAAYSPALTDFVFMVRGISQMFVTGPDVVASVTGERVTLDELGGADVHGTKSGVASFVYDEEQECLRDVRYLLSLLPDNNRGFPPLVAVEDPLDRRTEELLDLVPAEPTLAYDMQQVIGHIVDDGEFLEVQPDWAASIICVYARLGGQVVGILASQPTVLAGTIDVDASSKGARFVSTCDAFNVPIITLLDVPGFLPGVDQEHAGIVRHGAKMLYAYCSATVPRIQLILRKAFGGAYIVMDSPSIGADLSFAWPTNEVAVMGADGAASIIFRREIAAADDPVQAREECVRLYREELVHPLYAAERGLVDDVIDPADTRRTLIEGLQMLRTKHRSVPARKHGNPPI